MTAPANGRARELILQVGGNVQRTRLRRGWTQEHLAERIGLDLSYTQRVERGQVNLTLGTLAAFADALGLPPAALVRAGKPPVVKRGRPKSKDKDVRAEQRAGDGPNRRSTKRKP